uniref:Uncharacterized protein n=1 Tax=Arundo donax TaxID=35708 RepID=A0A0A8YX18_ARUDO
MMYYTFGIVALDLIPTRLRSNS